MLEKWQVPREHVSLVKLDLIRLPRKSERLHQAVMQNYRLVLKTELEIKLVLCKLWCWVSLSGNTSSTCFRLKLLIRHHINATQIIHHLIIPKGLVFSEPEEGNCSNMCRYRSRYFPISDSTGCGCPLVTSLLSPMLRRWVLVMYVIVLGTVGSELSLAGCNCVMTVPITIQGRMGTGVF